MRFPRVVVALLCAMGLAGCGGTHVIPTTSADSTHGAAITGMVHGGQSPIEGAHVYLLAVNSSATSTYGGPSFPDSGTNMSKSLLTSGDGSDSLGFYVTTKSDGSFTITGDYTCPSSYAHPYLYASGGYPGSGTSNSAITLVGAVSSCDTSDFVIINEVSTVVLAYSFAGFASDPTHVSASNSALATTALDNATSTITNLMDPLTSTAYATTPAGNGTVPQAEINTLANILAACVNSTGPTSTPCTTLFNDAPNGSSTVPTDTATAILNIAHNPGANITGSTGLFSLQTGNTVFQPDLSTAPNDFTIAVTYTGGGMNDPLGLAIDNAGDVWTTNTNGGANSLSEFSTVGAAISTSAGFTGGGLNSPYGIAIDSSGYVWAVNSGNNTLSKFNSSGSPASMTDYSGGGLASPTNICIDANSNLWIDNGFALNISEFGSGGTAAMGSPFSGGGIDGAIDVACDAASHVWISNFYPVLGELTTAGAPVAPSGYSGGGLNEAYGVAVDGSGNVWTANAGNTSISKFNSSGVAQSGSGGYTGGGLNSPQFIAVDGAGIVWVGNEGASTISEFNSSGTAITGSSGYKLPTTAVTRELAIDGSGNVWVTSYDVNNLTEFVGLASPVVTPVVANLLSPYGSHAVNLP